MEIDLKDCKVMFTTKTKAIVDRAEALSDGKAESVQDVADALKCTVEHVRKVARAHGCLILVALHGYCICNPNTRKQYAGD